MIDNDKSNKKLWTYIRSKNQENVGISDLKKGDTIIQEPKAKADVLNEQFSSVFSNPTPKIINESSEIKNNYPQMKPITITKNGVLKLLLNIKEHKATGPDSIPGRLLKMCAHELVEIYVILFQASLNQGKVPDDWKNANIVPLFKKRR